MSPRRKPAVGNVEKAVAVVGYQRSCSLAVVADAVVVAVEHRGWLSSRLG